MNSRWLRICAVSALILVFATASALAQVTVIFARHAEKAPAPANDPPLSEAGQKRAALLASMLADSGVDTIYVTELLRTLQTAAPLAEKLHLKPVVNPANDSNAVVTAIRSLQSGVVLVVGHSNTLPLIIAALGGPTISIPDEVYDNLFVLTVGPSQSSLLRLHYGSAATVSPAANSMKDLTPATPKR